MGGSSRTRTAIRRRGPPGGSASGSAAAPGPAGVMTGLGHAQVWWVDLDKIRPVVVLTRARVAGRLRRVLVAPITTTVRALTTEVPIGSPEGVREGSVANLDNIQL